MSVQATETIVEVDENGTGPATGSGGTQAKERITTPFMTKYERARVLGTRALQISMNAPLMVDPKGETDPLRIGTLVVMSGGACVCACVCVDVAAPQGVKYVRWPVLRGLIGVRGMGIHCCDSDDGVARAENPHGHSSVYAR